MHQASLTAGSSESLVLHLEGLLWPCNGDVALTAVALKVAGNSLMLPGMHMLLLSHYRTLHTCSTVAQASQAHVPTYTLGNTSTQGQNLLVCSDVSTG